jgi:DNA-binding MarR family transcriptional regulator
MPRAVAKTPKITRLTAEEKSSVRKKMVVDLTHYAPAYFTWIANKLSSGASQAYLAAFEVGIETWRLLVLLAIEESLSAKQACKVIGMDKASASRAFKTMQKRGLVTMSLDVQDGRLRVATITREGRELHDQILGIALDRDRALMSVLSPEERESLLALLRRLHDNLGAVESSTAQYLALHYPHAARKRTKTLIDE